MMGAYVLLGYSINYFWLVLGVTRLGCEPKHFTDRVWNLQKSPACQQNVYSPCTYLFYCDRFIACVL